MKWLEVKKIGFHGTTGDDRSPEDFAFPAAMTSLMEYLGEEYPILSFDENGERFTCRTGNFDFVAASGVGFGLLWEKQHCYSALDLMLCSPYDRGIENAFGWAGWEYERVTGEAMRAKAVTAIDAGRPFLAIGLTDPPETALVCGYDNGGETLVGWSHFQEGMPVAANGMFQKSGWEKDTWELILPVRRTGRRLSLGDILDAGIQIMGQTQVGIYAAGDAAHAAWQEAVAACTEEDEAFYSYHNSILFHLAEARCWCSEFLKSHGLKKAAERFHAVHDLCWEVSAAAPSAAALANREKREALLRALQELREMDAAALQALRAWKNE